MTERTCIVPGCDRLIAGSGMCKYHHKRWRLYGDPLEPSHRPRYTEAEIAKCRDLMRTGPFRKDGSLAQGLATDLALHLGRSPDSVRQKICELRKQDSAQGS